MTKTLFLSIMLLMLSALEGQAGVIIIDNYEEPRVGTKPDPAEWNALSDGLHASWASRDELYSLHRVPQLTETDEITVQAWKGERTNLEAVLFSKTDQGRLSLRFASKWCEARFLNYIITDDGRYCGYHDFDLVPWLVPDVIDQDSPHAVPAMETRPVWCTIAVPRKAKAGRHSTRLEVINEAGKVVKTLRLNIIVSNHTLPEVADWKFHLDLWQQPYSVSRYYGLERWSPEHLEALRPYITALARAGQKVVSTFMFYEPWGEQSHDKFSPLVQTTRRTDGSWTYDYTLFDRYVEFCAECGITKQINCYSMVPWDMTFRYFDEAKGQDVDLKTTPGSKEYNELWGSFLDGFKAHLIEKGWFDKTCIAMDERGEEAMLAAYEVAKTRGFKLALAGNYRSSLNDKLHDYCVASAQAYAFSEAERQYRREHNMVTTFYVCCAESEPNIFTNSLPAEATFLPLFAAASGMDGFLHWSWLNWDDHPLTDSRYRMFTAGDTYCYYPGNRSSVRFERLTEGIQQYEKIQVLREEWKDNPDRLRQLEEQLAAFHDYAVAGASCAQKVNDMEAFLNNN